MPDEVRAEIIRLAREGLSRGQILERVDVSEGGMNLVLRPFGGVFRAEDAIVPAGRLTLDDRVAIKAGIDGQLTFAAIGAGIGRHQTTISRDVKNNGGRDGYRPLTAHRAAAANLARPKATKLAENPELCDVVVAGLKRLWSPEQIAGQLREEFGNDHTMTVSHETIYKSLYVQGRGELRRELAACLRTGRAARKPQGRLERRGRIPGMVMISERPAEVEDRAVPGHWEGDLIIGKNNKSAIGTLVERSTRYVMLLRLADAKADTVRVAMTAKITLLPEHLRRSITWDQGIEMSEHARFSIDAGVPVYFCDPRSPWQRGSNENTNGLLRQYFPKGTDLSVHTEADLDAAADSLNTRPRKTLGWKTPAYKLNQLLMQ
jgi:IS30 family transposase